MISKASRQPRKQRKLRAILPLHKRRKLLSAPLSKTLRQTVKKRNVPVRKGDKVKITCGEYRGKEGKISGVDLSHYKVFVEGLTVKKPNGKEKPLPISPSNVLITELELSDEKRKKTLTATT